MFARTQVQAFDIAYDGTAAEGKKELVFDRPQQTFVDYPLLVRQINFNPCSF